MPYAITNSGYRAVENRDAANLQPGETYVESVPAELENKLQAQQEEFEQRRTQSALVAEANRNIGPLQAAKDIDEATDAELALLIEWKRYLIALGKVAEQTGWPSTVHWPVPPQ